MPRVIGGDEHKSLEQSCALKTKLVENVDLDQMWHEVQSAFCPVLTCSIQGIKRWSVWQVGSPFVHNIVAVLEHAKDKILMCNVELTTSAVVSDETRQMQYRFYRVKRGHALFATRTRGAHPIHHSPHHHASLGSALGTVWSSYNSVRRSKHHSSSHMAFYGQTRGRRNYVWRMKMVTWWWGPVSYWYSTIHCATHETRCKEEP